jgi:molybdenum cofactor cytidylyltransferase
MWYVLCAALWLTFVVEEISAILLAAGRSRRMGAFKPLLPFGNRTVIESCIDNLRAAEVEDIVVVVGHRAEEIQKRLRTSRLTFALNPDPDSEMGESIARGVEQVSSSTRALLIALVDHPAVPAEIIKLVVDEWRRGARLVQPEHQGRGGHPVLIDLAFRKELLSLNPESGLRGLFAAHRDLVKRLPVESPYVARDMDTWEDYRRLHQDVLGISPEKN